tara:strand:- start:38161 stop:40878 length:2718 start_codon:yes stop_codon:yes gene_type:complete
MGKTASGLRRVIGGLFVGLTAFAAVRATAGIISEFEATLVLVGATAQASAAELNALESSARNLGATTRFTAAEAGEGLLFLARAGFDVQQSIEALPSTLNLAQVGLLDLGQAADFASNIVSQFGLEAEETARVVDSLVIASNRANTSVGQAAEAMKFAGTVLGQLGVQVEDTANLIGVLGDRGIQASLAGTNLRAAFLKLQAPTSAAEAALSKYGLSIGDVDVKANDFIDVFEKLRPLLKDSAAAVDVFGLRNIAAAQTISLSTDKLRELRIEQIENRGEAERIARVMDETLSGAFKTLISSIQEATLVTGDAGFGGALRDMTTTLTGAVRVLSGTATSENRVTEASIALAAAITGVTTTLIALAVAFVAVKIIAFIAGVGGLTAAVTVLGTALTTTTGLIGLMAISAGVIIAAVDFIAESMVEASRATLRFANTMAELRRGVVGTAAAVQRARFDFERAFEFGDEVGQIRALESQLKSLETEIFNLSLLDASQEKLQLFSFADVAKILPEEQLQQLADDLFVDLDKAINNNVRQIGVQQLRESLEDGIATLNAQVDTIVVPLSIGSSDGGLDTDALENAASSAAAQLGQAFADLQFEQSLIGATADEVERLRAAREVESLASAAQLVNVQALTNAYVAELTVLQQAEAAERTRIANRERQNQIANDSLISTSELIASLQRENELAQLTNNERRRAIILHDFETRAIGLNVDQRKELLDLLEQEIGKLENLTENTARNATQLEMFGQQVGDTLKAGIADAILDYNNLGDVAEAVFEQIRAAAVRAAVAAAFGPNSPAGFLNFAGGQAKGGAFGTGGRMLTGFASGGVISQPGLINSAEGLRPVAENGPEGILPLKRGSDGKLGVQSEGGGGSNMTINQTIVTPDAQSFRQSERQIRNKASRFIRG